MLAHQAIDGLRIEQVAPIELAQDAACQLEDVQDPHDGRW